MEGKVRSFSDEFDDFFEQSNMIISSSPVFRSDLVSGDTETQHELTFLLVTKLICALWPIAQNSNDFVDPMLKDHTENWFC